jgi:Uma2 family endonuclease
MTAAMNDVPPVDGWTVEDLEGLPEDGVRRELLDGVLHGSPSPAPNHQVIAARLMVALEEACPEHYHVSQANDVILSANRLFIPDVLVTTDAAASRNAKFMADEVVLAVEILSPSSQSMDRVMKPALYAKAGIPFYWLVELSGTFTIHTHKLEFDNEIYRPTGSFTDTVKLDEPWGIEIPLARLRPRHL